jgi:hypothetical protein
MKILLQQIIGFYNFDALVAFMIFMTFLSGDGLAAIALVTLKFIVIFLCHSVDKCISNLHFLVSMLQRNLEYTAEGFKIL